MFQVFRKELNWGGRRLVLETGKMARQADGAVLATYGETTVPSTAVAAVTVCGITFMVPIAGCRVGYIDGQYVLNPTLAQLPRSQLDLLVAGTGEGVLMVESEAKELAEDVMLGAVTFGHQSFQPVVNAIIELAETCAKEPWNVPAPPANKAAIEARLREAVGPLLDAAYRERGKQARSDLLDSAKAKAESLFEEEAERALALKLFKDL